AEDGIRDWSVTGVQTCALPIGGPRSLTLRLRHWDGAEVQLEAADVVRRDEPTQDPTERTWALQLKPGATGRQVLRLTGSVPLERSEERRVGEEGGRWWRGGGV